MTMRAVAAHCSSVSIAGSGKWSSAHLLRMSIEAEQSAYASTRDPLERCAMHLSPKEPIARARARR